MRCALLSHFALSALFLSSYLRAAPAPAPDRYLAQITEPATAADLLALSQIEEKLQTINFIPTKSVDRRSLEPRGYYHPREEEKEGNVDELLYQEKSRRWSVFQPPRDRKYDFEITYGVQAPDGVPKKRILINGQSPGPKIECNEGDTIVVRVHNKLDVGTSIHWHGLYQNSTPWMDGVGGFSQCGIPAGGSFEYRFKVDGQFGTYWYHSHAAVQYTDGLYGPFIVHSRREPYQIGRDYDEERIIMVADNYHDYANDVVLQMLSTMGYKGSSFAPSPQSGIINGHGVFDCTKTSRPCRQQTWPTMQLQENRRYRLRFINSGSHAVHWLSVDEHVLTVIGADGTAVRPHEVHRIPSHNGQRYDAILTTDQGRRRKAFFMRMTIQTDCMSETDPALDPTVNMTMIYGSVPDHGKPIVPQSVDWPDAIGTQCVDLDDADLVPVIEEDVPENRNRDSLGILTNQFGNITVDKDSLLGRFFVNQRSYVNFVNKPYLEAVNRGGNFDSGTVANVVIPDDIWIADLIINNADTRVDHPYHLHGMESYIVKRGKGLLTADAWANMDVDIVNPLRRDTFLVRRSEWAVIRLFSDLPGVWPLHCHIGFHLAGGFMSAIAVHPDKIRSMKVPNSVRGLCPTDPKALDETEIP